MTAKGDHPRQDAPERGAVASRIAPTRGAATLNPGSTVPRLPRTLCSRLGAGRPWAPREP